MTGDSTHHQKHRHHQTQYRNPIPTVDAIIEYPQGIVLIHRKNPPYGWALPGGFVDYGESLEDAVIREVKEEVSLEVELVRQFHTYSRPDRDPRQHTVTTVFLVKRLDPDKFPRAADDAADVEIFGPQSLPEEIAFDHREILEDYFRFRDRGIDPAEY